MRPAVVSRVFRDVAPTIHWISLSNGQTLGATPDHEVWTERVGWGSVSDILVGDAFHDEDKNSVLVESIEISVGSVPVYNFEVAGTFTYFASGVWVHNDSCEKWQAYRYVRDGDVVYVGMTSREAGRILEHLREKGLSKDSFQTVFPNLSYSDARAVEQALIEIHGLRKNGGSLINKINSIAESNPVYAEQLTKGMALLQKIDYEDLLDIK